MKKLIFGLFAISISLAFVAGGNLNKKLANTTVSNIKGGTIKSADFVKGGKPAVVSFWSTICIPCIKELNAINGKYDSWKKETGVEVFAVSTDDARFQSRVPAIAGKKGWEFPVVIDKDGSLFKPLGITNVPYTVVLDKTGKIVYEHNSYKAGDEEEIYKVLKSLQ